MHIYIVPVQYDYSAALSPALPLRKTMPAQPRIFLHTYISEAEFGTGNAFGFGWLGNLTGDEG